MAIYRGRVEAVRKAAAADSGGTRPDPEDGSDAPERKDPFWHPFMSRYAMLPEAIRAVNTTRPLPSIAAELEDFMDVTMYQAALGNHNGIVDLWNDSTVGSDGEYEPWLLTHHRRLSGRNILRYF